MGNSTLRQRDADTHARAWNNSLLAATGVDTTERESGETRGGRLTSEVMRVPLSRMPTVEFEVATPVDIAGEESLALSGVPIAMTVTVTLHDPASPSPNFELSKFDQCQSLTSVWHWSKMLEATKNGQKLSLSGIVRDPGARY